MTEFAKKITVDVEMDQVDYSNSLKIGIREKISRAAAACILGSSLALTAFAAEEIIDQDYAVAYNAETGDYPWPDAAELNSQNSDYGYVSCPDDASNCKRKTIVKNGIAYGVYDPWGYYFRNCTSYVAWRVAQEFGVDAFGLGNATTWNNNAGAKGWSIDRLPEVGDIAHYEGNDSEPWRDPGHVAFVEEIGTGVNAGKVRIAEYNQGLDGRFSNDRWVAISNVTNFIDVNGPNPAGFKLKIGEGGGAVRPQETTTIPWSFATLEGDSSSVSGRTAETGATPAAIEFNDKLYAFSYDESNGNLRLAVTNGSSWSFTTLEGDPGSLSHNNANVGQTPTVVVYGNSLHAFYYTQDGGNLRHAWSSNGQNWNFETLDGAGGTAGRRDSNLGHTPTAVVYNDTLQLFYRDSDRKTLRHAWTGNQQGWRFEDLEGTPGSISHHQANVGHDPEAVVWNNQLHLYHYDDTQDNLRHAWISPIQGWRFENLDGDPGSICGLNGEVGKNPSATSHGSTMHLLYYDKTGGNLRHAWTGTTQGWRCETVEGDSGAALGYNSDVGAMPTITSTGGNLQAFAYQPEWGALRHYWWDANGTHSENLDGLGGSPVGRQNAWTGLDPVVVPYNGKLYVFYYAESKGDLRVAVG